jgi:hypothetical protein
MPVELTRVISGEAARAPVRRGHPAVTFRLPGILSPGKTSAPIGRTGQSGDANVSSPSVVSRY